MENKNLHLILEMWQSQESTLNSFKIYLNYKTETTLMLLSSCDAATVVCAVVVLL